MLRMCTEYGSLIIIPRELSKPTKTVREEDLRKGLRQNVELKKAMHPFDAKERPSLYQINFVNTEQLIENFSIFLGKVQNGNEHEGHSFSIRG